MSSRLFNEVREKRGLVYGVKSALDLGRNYGYLVIWAGCDPQNAREVIKICKREFVKMKDLTEEELAEVKEMIIGKNVLQGEGSNDVAIELIMEEFAIMAEEVYKFEEKINSVSLNEVRGLAKNIEFAEFLVGP